MSMQLDRWTRLVAALTLALALTCVWGCGEDENDSEDDDTGGLPPDDDDDDDDDTAADDDDDDYVGTMTIQPEGEGVPVGSDATFVAYVNLGEGPVELDPADVAWSVNDDQILSVAAGVVTGLAAGTASVTAEWDDGDGHILSTWARVVVGPDVYVLDAAGLFGTIDRVAETYVQDALAARAAVAVVPNHITANDGYAFITDSGDYGAGLTGNEKVVRIDLADFGVNEATLEIDSPWATVPFGATTYTTGNLDDRLAKVDWEGGDNATIALPENCVPASLTVAAGKVYVGCTGFVDFSYLDGKLAVVDLDDHVTTIDLTKLNPYKLVPTADESAVYVTTAGNYADVMGAIVHIDTATDQVAGAIDMDVTLGPASLGADGRLWVLGGGNAYVLDTATDTFLRGPDDPIAIADPAVWLTDIMVHPDTNEVYVGYVDFGGGLNQVVVLDADTYAVKTTYDVTGIFAMPQGFAAW